MEENQTTKERESMNAKSWKTTLVGWLTGGAVGLIPVLQTGRVDYKSLLIGFGIGLLGTVAKDGDVTGGTR